MKNLLHILKDIKVEHTLFAMPFAVMSAFIAAGGMPGARELLLLMLALFFARSAAMAFNRLSDASFDSTNPRTKNRPLASGTGDRAVYVLFVVGTSAAFIVTCMYINFLAFKLSPFALAIIFFYSFTKRFTPYSHFFLGLALSLSPIGAWVAIKGEFSAESLLLGGAVIFWLVGLDIIYSCQDYDHDKEEGLNSIPTRFGIKKALAISSAAHLLMIIFLVVLYMVSDGLGAVYQVGVFLTASLLWYQHYIVSPDDLKRVNVAFFNVNGIISVGLMLFVITDTLV